ncbi:MAG TPA: hypothetical protein VJ779_21915 [Acetobacteraceae bacterium]|nr:hypothetical protein [Acetobacteraceae bacterium]
MPDTDAYIAFREAAQSAVERAHEAALDMRGAELRQGLEDALSALADAEPLAPDPAAASRLRELAELVRRALDDFDKGKLAELGKLVEDARKELLS